MRIVELHHTSHACPAQWEGVLADGRHLYVRYRYGTLFVGVGETLADAVFPSFDNPRGEMLMNEMLKPADPYGGYMTEEEMLRRLRDIGITKKKEES